MEYKEGDIVTVKFANGSLENSGIVMFVDNAVKKEPVYYFVLFIDIPYVFDSAIQVKAYDPLNIGRPFPFLIGCKNEVRENLQKN